MGDANPKYKDLPRPESIVFFEGSVSNHSKVTSLQKIKEQCYKVERRDKSTLMLYLTNLYIVGIADVHDIKIKFPKVNCIVTISSWNSYSGEAKEFCIANDIGLFRYAELYGALYFDNKKFYNYVPQAKDKKP